MTSRVRKWAMSSPPAEWAVNQMRELLISAVQRGPVPRHIAFVMDGNRRFARNNRIETVEGHNLGFEALARVLEVSFKAGVECVTVYAFSIENFKRSKYEVDGLMDMAKVKLTQLAQHGELLERYGARVKVIGQRSMLKADVLEAIDRAERMTAHNDKCTLNICFPYTSREEITTGIQKTVEEFSKPLTPPTMNKKRRNSAFKEERIANTIRSQHLTEHVQSQQSSTSPSRQSRQQTLLSPSSSTTSLSLADTTSSVDHDIDSSSISSATTFQPDSTDPDTDLLSPPSKMVNKLPHTNTTSTPMYSSPELITPEILDSHMYTASDPPLDLLIRTSGVARLSDFMLWQCHEHTQIVFLDILWPEFDLWSFLPVLWEWQWRARKAEKLDKVRDLEDRETMYSKKSSSKTKPTTTAAHHQSKTKNKLVID